MFHLWMPLGMNPGRLSLLDCTKPAMNETGTSTDTDADGERKHLTPPSGVDAHTSLAVSAAANGTSASTAVPGLFLISNFLSEAQEAQLAREIDVQAWIDNRSRTRRVQMYGPVHDRNYKIHRNGTVTRMPDFCTWLIALVKAASLKQKDCAAFRLDRSQLGVPAMTEVFVNEYDAGASLDFHTDHRSTYEEVICGVSLLSDCYFSFKRGAKIERVWVPRRSLYLMTGSSRYDYQHGLQRGDIKGKRRVSVTFRIVNASKMIA